MSDQDYRRDSRIPQHQVPRASSKADGQPAYDGAPALSDARRSDSSAARPAAPTFRDHRTPHVTQAPINDVDPVYAMPQRYATLEQQGSVGTRPGRKHMGTATSDPQHLPLTEDEARKQRAWEQQQAARQGVAGERAGHPQGGPAMDAGRKSAAPRQPGLHPASTQRGPQQLHGARYLQKPTSGKAIFTSQRSRKRHGAQVLLAILILLAVILAAVWFFALR